MPRVAAEKRDCRSIRRVSDALPALDHVHSLGLAYDLVLLSAVSQHVSPADRSRAFRKLVGLMKPGGVLVMTLRHGPAPPEMQMHSTSTAEVEGLAHRMEWRCYELLPRPIKAGEPA